MALNLSNLINIFAAPTEVFQNIKTSPKWFITFVVIAIVSIIYSYLMFPFMQIILEQTLQVQMDDQRVQQTLSAMKISQIIGLLLALVPLLIKWLFISLLLYYGAILLNAQQIKFKPVFSTVVHSEFILLLMGVINLLIVYINGVESINGPTDLNAIIGLDYFLTDRSSNLPLFTFLNSFNIFSIWYVSVLAIGIFIVAEISKLKSAILASSIWFIIVGIQVGFVMLSESFQGMMGR